ncbi:uncharacterized protein LOC108602374 [Drosophila busckii]|uniref:uncharacterized protein LOC108602374 n=1 Tax=Drosophila busckii TaxID=30019 RepID=UPI00083F2FE8|nr:uncharacterized protein LOC108602374 [Drosophila busckii]
MCRIVIVIVAALALFAGHVLTQDVAKTCFDASGITWNNTEYFDTWMEIGRNPIQNTPGCVAFTANLTNDNVTLAINGSHSANPTALYADIRETARVNLSANNFDQGYNVSFTSGSTQNAPVTIKLLEYVNNTYLVGCGFTNKSDISSSFGFILSRSEHNGTLAAKEAASRYSIFQNNATYGQINQQGCKKSSAGQSLPMISGVVALALLLIKAH